MDGFCDNGLLFQKYREALKLYVEAKNLSRSEICRRCNVSDGAFSHFLKKHFPHLIRNGKRVKNPYLKKQKAETKRKYKKAIELYCSTDLTIKEISEDTKVSVSGLRHYINKYHRDVMFKRKNIDVKKYEPSKVKIRKKGTGQTIHTYLKYKDAISACSSNEFIENNISEIARLFNLNPSSLGNQLRVHFPEILNWRENERERLGINNNRKRGERKETNDKYAKAREMARVSDFTLEEIANQCGVSLSGLKFYLSHYHKDIIKIRSQKRDRALKIKKKGEFNGAWQVNRPKPENEIRYKEAVNMYRDSLLPIKDISSILNVPLNGFIYHLYRWHRDLVLKRKDIRPDDENEFMDLTKTTRFLKSTKIKYSKAIEGLKEGKFESIAEAALKNGFNPDTFRDYISNHEPELAVKFGKIKLENGKTVLKRSEEKYAEAINLFKTTPDSLRSIAERLGIVYVSLWGFIKRNFPEAIEIHNSLT